MYQRIWRWANQWFEKAANNGHSKAMYELGVSYIEGRGVSKNSDIGIEYLSRAAENNSAEACALLAKLYKSGIQGYKGQDNYTSLLDAKVYAKKMLSFLTQRNQNTYWLLFYKNLETRKKLRYGIGVLLIKAMN